MATMVDNIKPPVKPPAAPRVREQDDDGGWMGKPATWWRTGRTFLTEVRNELKRVTWPSRKEVYATTVVVILTSLFFGVYLFALDYMFGLGRDWFFRTFGGV
jgi:preprotein translocase subunit SecE